VGVGYRDHRMKWVCQACQSTNEDQIVKCSCGYVPPSKDQKEIGTSKTYWMTRDKINTLSIWFGVTRLFVYLIFFHSDTLTAQWQLGYIPLWIIDLPVTILYFKLPIPIGEAVIGPIWWACLPQLAWFIYFRTRSGPNRIGRT
jgi:hypothetical protein